MLTAQNYCDCCFCALLVQQSIQDVHEESDAVSRSDAVYPHVVCIEWTKVRVFDGHVSGIVGVGEGQGRGEVDQGG